MDTQEAKRIAETILAQLGGHKFGVMTGARNYRFDTDGSLSFMLPGNRINYVKITLNSLDLYDIDFRHTRRRRGFYEQTVISHHDNIYADMLRGIFEKETGLRTSLTEAYA